MNAEEFAQPLYELRNARHALLIIQNALERHRQELEAAEKGVPTAGDLKNADLRGEIGPVEPAGCAQCTIVCAKCGTAQRDEQGLTLAGFVMMREAAWKRLDSRLETVEKNALELAGNQACSLGEFHERLAKLETRLGEAPDSDVAELEGALRELREVQTHLVLGHGSYRRAWSTALARTDAILKKREL